MTSRHRLAMALRVRDCQRPGAFLLVPSQFLRGLGGPGSPAGTDQRGARNPRTYFCDALVSYFSAYASSTLLRMRWLFTRTARILNSRSAIWSLEGLSDIGCNLAISSMRHQNLFEKEFGSLLKADHLSIQVILLIRRQMNYTVALIALT